MGSAKELALILVLLISAWSISAIVGTLPFWLLVASLIWIIIQLREYRKIQRWSERPLSRPANAFDSWFGVAYRPFRSLMRQRERTHSVVRQLREILGLIEVIPDAVITLSPNGEIESLNVAAQNMLNLSDKEIGLSLAAVIRDPDFVTFLRSDKFDEPLELRSPVRNAQTLEARRFDAGTGRTVLFVRDITALNRLLTMRQDFIANVSHELRTPLTVINGYLETLTDPETPQELRFRLAQKLESPVDRMQSLINDLLLLTQLESGSSHQAPSIVPMPSVIKRVAADLKEYQSGNVDIQVQLLSDCTVMGMEQELHSVCSNLMTNAIRYSPAGKPIKVTWMETNDGKARLMVEDKGVGIPQEHLQRITERFYRVDMAGSTTRGGTGLGLAIVKHVLRRHNSELHVSSELGKGSCFYCDFTPNPSQNETNQHSSSKP
jgi:two-component system phosphate regulon sensor histidine kinase PhoR